MLNFKNTQQLIMQARASREWRTFLFKDSSHEVILLATNLRLENCNKGSRYLAGFLRESARAFLTQGSLVRRTVLAMLGTPFWSSTNK
jgi:hypothetical protein